MKAPRVYHRERLQVGRDVELEAAAAHRVARVLRMRPGESIVLFDGSGGEHTGTVCTVDRRRVRVRVDAFDPIERESPLQVGLAQVVSAAERMEMTVQKAVELGVAWIQPLTARRAKVRLAGERAERRVEHWRRVASAACEQCGRNLVPHVHSLLDYPQWLGAVSDTAQRLMLDPRARRRLSDAGPLSSEVILLAGGESGFDPEEAELAIQRRFVPVALGPRVLRTETAGLAALAAIQALWGDF